RRLAGVPAALPGGQLKCRARRLREDPPRLVERQPGAGVVALAALAAGRLIRPLQQRLTGGDAAFQGRPQPPGFLPRVGRLQRFDNGAVELLAEALPEPVHPAEDAVEQPAGAVGLLGRGELDVGEEGEAVGAKVEADLAVPSGYHPGDGCEVYGKGRLL